MITFNYNYAAITYDFLCLYVRRRCLHKKSGKFYAVKIVSRRVNCSEEIRLLRTCKGHPNIVDLYDVLQDEVGRGFWFQI